MTTKKQRTTRRPKTPETPAEAGLTRAVEELVASGEYNGEQGFHDLVKLVSRRFVEAALRGELDAHLKEETRMRESLSGVDEEDESLPINKRHERQDFTNRFRQSANQCPQRSSGYV